MKIINIILLIDAVNSRKLTFLKVRGGAKNVEKTEDLENYLKNNDLISDFQINNKSDDTTDNTDDFESKIENAMAKFGLSSNGNSDEKEENSEIVHNSEIEEELVVELTNDEKYAKLMELNYDEYSANLALISNNFDLEKAIQFLEDQKNLADKITDKISSEETENETLTKLIELVGKEGTVRALALTCDTSDSNNDITINYDTALALVLAEIEEELEERTEAAKQEQATKVAKPIEVTIPANFDPAAANLPAPPPPASKVIELESSKELFTLLSDHKFILLDVYADWCGPCKQILPILKQTLPPDFALLKVNSENVRDVCDMLGVRALPTLFGIHQGQFVFHQEGAPRSQQQLDDMYKKIRSGSGDDEKLSEMSTKFLKLASFASYSFQKRERMEEIVSKRLDEFYQDAGSDLTSLVLEEREKKLAVMELLARILNNCASKPFDTKYRSVNLKNKVVAEKLEGFGVSLLQIAGFKLLEDGNQLVYGDEGNLLHLAPIAAMRDCIQKYHKLEKAKFVADKRKVADDTAREGLEDTLEAQRLEREGKMKERQEEAARLNKRKSPKIRIRFQGQKQVHEFEDLNSEMTLNEFLKEQLCHKNASLKDLFDDGNDNVIEQVSLLCAAKRMTIPLTTVNLHQSISQLELLNGNWVVQLPILEETSVDHVDKEENNEKENIDGEVVEDENPSNVSEDKKKSRFDESRRNRRRKGGSHTMQSVGIFSTEDGNKAETFESGGTVWDHDVSSDDEEDEQK